MILLLKNLRNGQNHFELQALLASLDLPAEVRGETLGLDVRVQAEDGFLLFDFRAELFRERPCDRCAVELELEDTVAGRVTAFQGEELPQGVDPEEIHLIKPEDEEFSLAAELRDEILLTLEERVYCREDCKGLCPQCGQDLNEEACDCQKQEAAAGPLAGLARFRRDES